MVNVCDINVMKPLLQQHGFITLISHTFTIRKTAFLYW